MARVQDNISTETILKYHEDPANLSDEQIAQIKADYAEFCRKERENAIPWIESLGAGSRLYFETHIADYSSKWRHLALYSKKRRVRKKYLQTLIAAVLSGG